MTLPKLTLTQAKATSASAWAIVAALQATAVFFPLRGLPLPLKIVATVVLLAAAVLIVYTALDIKVEKPDERAAQNSYRAGAALYEFFFFLFALYVLFGERLGFATITVTHSELILFFAVINLLHDGFFLLYERFGK